MIIFDHKSLYFGILTFFGRFLDIKTLVDFPKSKIQIFLTKNYANWAEIFRPQKSKKFQNSKIQVFISKNRPKNSEFQTTNFSGQKLSKLSTDFQNFKIQAFWPKLVQNISEFQDPSFLVRNYQNFKKISNFQHKIFFWSKVIENRVKTFISLKSMFSWPKNLDFEILKICTQFW